MKNLNNMQLFKNSLTSIASILNDENINWALGGSLLLYLYGLDSSVADIDIVIDVNDMNKVNNIFKKFNHIEKSKNDIYLTEKFYSISLKNINIDLMIGFKVLTDTGVYSFPTGEKLVDKSIIIDRTSINLCSLNDWLEAYKAMERTNKIKLIEKSKLVK